MAGPTRTFLIAATLATALVACTRTPSPATDGATARPPTASTGPTGSASAAQAYYAGLVARHDGGYAACGPSVRRQADACDAAGDAAAPTGPARVLLMLDASGSMAARIGGETKMRIAQDALVDFSRALPGDTQVGLRVYGHLGDNTAAGRPRSCAGTQLSVPFAPLDAPAFERSVRALEPAGWTPIAASLQAAADDFADAAGARNVVYMVSDGIETCDGDPVAAARALREARIAVTVNVIGFDVGATDARQLQAIARAGGGEYLGASSRADLHRIFNERIARSHARYNCASREQHGAYNATSRAQHGRYNCLSRRAHGEYNAISREARADFNAKRIDAAVRHYALDQAHRKREGILTPARQERDAVLDAARSERDAVMDAERRARDTAVDGARAERDARTR